MVNKTGKLREQVDDAAFLEQRFGMTPRQASKLVARDGTDPEALREASEKAAQTDPLGDAPEPASPAKEFTPDTDEQLLKPVLHTKNDHVGGG